MRAKRRQIKLTKKRRVARLLPWDILDVDRVDTLAKWPQHDMWYRGLRAKRNRAIDRAAAEEMEEIYLKG